MRYYVSDARGNLKLVDKSNQVTVSLQNEGAAGAGGAFPRKASSAPRPPPAVLDFPKQQVITRDNAMISLDALLNYKVRAAAVCAPPPAAACFPVTNTILDFRHLRGEF